MEGPHLPTTGRCGGTRARELGSYFCGGFWDAGAEPFEPDTVSLSATLRLPA